MVHGLTKPNLECWNQIETKNKQGRKGLLTYTVFPHIVAAATILFWKFECGNYSREETIQRRKVLFYCNFWLFDIILRNCINQLQWMFLLLKNIENLAKIVFSSKKNFLFCGKKMFSFGFKWCNLLGQIKYNFRAEREKWSREEKYSSEDTIQGGKLFKGGNY